MKNQYLNQLTKLEFVVTYACTGKCKHCSEGEHSPCGERIDPRIASDAVRKIAAEYDIKTVMAFGGEPLLYTDAVYAIMNAACEMRVPKRQVITNGYFSKNIDRIRETVKRLAECGVNDLLLSVDAFHQETLPLDVVKRFAEEAKKCGIPIRLQPAWLVSPSEDNPYNRKTRADVPLYIASFATVIPQPTVQAPVREIPHRKLYHGENRHRKQSRKKKAVYVPENKTRKTYPHSVYRTYRPFGESAIYEFSAFQKMKYDLGAPAEKRKNKKINEILIHTLIFLSFLLFII